jgi:hypothetical protein
MGCEQLRNASSNPLSPEMLVVGLVQSGTGPYSRAFPLVVVAIAAWRLDVSQALPTASIDDRFSSIGTKEDAAVREGAAWVLRAK